MPSLRLKSCCSLILAIIIMLSGVVAAPAYAGTDLGPANNSTLVEGQSGFSPVDAPRMLQGKLADQIYSDSDVINYFTSNSQTFGLTEAIISPRIVKKTSDAQGKQHYLIQQHYKGLPIYGDYITAHVNMNNEIYAATDDTSTEIDGISLDTQPAFDSNQALSLLKAAIESDIGYAITLGGHFASRELGMPKTELIVYPFNGNYYLTYRLDLEYLQPTMGRWIGFVDAHTGTVLKKYNSIEQAAPVESTSGMGNGYYGDPRVINITEAAADEYYLTDKTKSMYRIENGREKGVIETYDIENPFFPISSSTKRFVDPEAVDAHYFAGQVYDFYLDRYGRDSLDGKGMSIISVVNEGAVDNAFWNGYEVVYGDGDQAFECLTCANDVIAHELTHAVTQYSANLEYSGQSGALNESISDIMAAVFDDQDWAIGEDSGIAGGNGVLRDLARPDLGIPPQPSKMAEYVNLPEDIDNGGVHKNSGIPNHAAYLIATGIDAIPALQGQGRTLLGQITYGALTSYLTPTSGFKEARDSFVLAAGDLLIPDDQKNAVIAAVKASWATVGLPYSNSENDIVSLNVTGMEGKPEINSLAHTVTFRVKYGTNLNGLMAQIGISPGAAINPDPVIPQNFAEPVAYTITPQEGQSQTWMVQGSISDPKSFNDIISFNADVLTGPAIIDPIQHKVTLYVEANDEVTAIQPSLELSEGASVSPASGTSVNLGQPVTYTVTAENGTTQPWLVTVIKDSTSPKVLGAVSLRSTIVAVVFDKPMDFSTLGNASNYQIESLLTSYSNPQITKVEVDCADARIVYLTTSDLVSQNGYKLSVSNLKGTNGYSVRSDWTTGYFLTDDTVQPVVNTARIDGKQLALTFNEYVKGAYGTNTFSVEVNNVTARVDSITTIGRRVILTLDSVVAPADSVNVSYIPTQYVGEVSDLSGNMIPSFNRMAVLNRTDVIKPSAGDGWAHLNGTIKQMIKHPTEPIIYTIFASSVNVVSSNMETGDTNTVTMDRQPERLYLSGGKLYIALVDRAHSSYAYDDEQTGSIAILDETTLETLDQFNVLIDPFDMVVDANGIIYVSSGSGQWTDIVSISPLTKSVIHSVTIRQASYLQNGGPNRIYSITTDSSPRDIHAFNVSTDGQFTIYQLNMGGYDSPYHGDYRMSTYLRISPDYKYLFNGAGTIFTTSPIKDEDMTYLRTIEAFSSIVFSDDLLKFYTLSGQTLRTYNYATFALEKEVVLPSTASEILPGNKSNELLVAYKENGGTTIVPYSLEQNIPALSGIQSLTGQAAASSGYGTINACPISVPPVIIPPVIVPPVIVPPVYPPAGPSGGIPSIPVPPLSNPTVLMDPDDLMMTKGTDEHGDLKSYFKPNPDKFQQALLDAQEGVNNKQVIPKIIIPVGELGRSLTVELPASTLVEANRTTSKAVIVIQSNNMTYELPVQVLNGDNLEKAWGSNVDLNSVQIKVGIEKVDSSLRGLIQDQLTTEGYQSLTNPVNFTIMLEKQGISKEITDFNGTYITSSFTLDKREDSSHVTALVYDPETKTFHFVPALLREVEGKAILDIKTPHNSIYTVASSLKTFKDISGHWAKNDIEIMASKRVVFGINDAEFNPDKQVTRSEFAALLVRALGLATPQVSSVRFLDVDQNAWYAPTVSVATQTGLIAGDTKGRFTPNGIITRQEMAAMINRAIKYAGDSGNLVVPDKKSISIDTITDAESIKKWAAEDIKNMLDSGILEIGLDGKFEPALPVTRANAVVALKRMLLSLGFI